MKSILKYAAFLFLSGIIFLISCKKEYSCENCAGNPPTGGTNKSPIANAGADQTINLPIDSVKLDGSLSSDPDGTISSYQWTKISGPASFTIITASVARTSIKQLVRGVYQFELKVTDNGGLSAKDTVQIIVSDPTQPNRPPVSNAGADQTITLPTNTINVDGSGSIDPDNNITSYAWTKITGPSSFNIINANAAQTQVTNLVQGTYQFELKVTDAGGLFSKDTMQVTVLVNLPACDNTNRPLVNLQLLPVALLPKPRIGMAIASAGNKIVFAGGGCYCVNDTFTARVDIYDITQQTWSTAQLSEARNNISAVAAGEKIFFAGGEVGDGTWPVTTVDIYNATTNEWSTSQLSTAGHTITAATVGDKILFAGGDGGFTGQGRDTRVDIYNLTSNSWSTAQLSEPKEGPTAVTANGKVFFSGGYTHNNSIHFVSDKIEIYNNATNTWSVAVLNERRVAHGGIAVADKIYWAGGSTTVATSLLCSVEVRDVNTGNTVIQSLSEASVGPAFLKNNKILFFTINGINDNTIDIYDVPSASWSIGVLPQSMYGCSVISVNNTIYVTGRYVNGILSNQIWKLEF